MPMSTRYVLARCRPEYSSYSSDVHRLLPAGLRVAQPCRYCFYSMVQKWVFRPAGTTRCPDKREIWDWAPCEISRLSRRKCGNTAPKTVKISNFGHKKSLGVQKWYGPPLSYGLVGIVSRAPAVDEKVLFFCLFVCLSRFGITKFVITETLYSSIRPYYQYNYGVTACMKACSCAPILNFLFGPQIFFHRGKFIPKIAIFEILRL